MGGNLEKSYVDIVKENESLVKSELTLKKAIDANKPFDAILKELPKIEKGDTSPYDKPTTKLTPEENLSNFEIDEILFKEIATEQQYNLRNSNGRESNRTTTNDSNLRDFLVNRPIDSNTDSLSEHDYNNTPTRISQTDLTIEANSNFINSQYDGIAPKIKISEEYNKEIGDVTVGKYSYGLEGRDINETASIIKTFFKGKKQISDSSSIEFNVHSNDFLTKDKNGTTVLENQDFQLGAKFSLEF